MVAAHFHTLVGLYNVPPPALLVHLDKEGAQQPHGVHADKMNDFDKGSFAANALLALKHFDWVLCEKSLRGNFEVLLQHLEEDRVDEEVCGPHDVWMDDDHYSLQQAGVVDNDL